MLKYPVILIPDTNGKFLVGFPDFPEANSVGNDEADALVQAVDALEVALDMYFEDRRPIPSPSEPAPGQLTVSLPALATAKALL
jgi:antitoxin HicB